MRTFAPSLSSLALTLALPATLAACASEEALCDRAAAHVAECFDGTELTECTDAIAETLLARSCDDIVTDASLDPKEDGSIFCPSFLWWLCGERPGVSVSCPDAPPTYEYSQLTSAERLDYHWSWVQCTEYGQSGIAGPPTGLWDNAVNSFHALSAVKGMANVFDVTDDERVDRAKLFHPYGSVARAELVAAEPDPACHTEYTGMFSQASFDANTTPEGERVLPALLRLSWGAAPGTPGFYYIPGVALKFMVEGDDSINLHLIPTINGDPDEPNFFGQSPTNVLVPEDGIFGWVARQLCLFADHPNHLRLDHTALREADGTVIAQSDAVAPYQLTFEPTSEAYDLYEDRFDDGYADLRDVLASYEAGSILYEVYVRSEAGGCREHLGSVRLATPLVPSQWGDFRLFFRHAPEDQNQRNVPSNFTCGL